MSNSVVAQNVSQSTLKTPGAEPRCRILVIEDDMDIAGLIRLHLSDMGCEVILATDGLTGLELSLGRAFDLIVLDLGLPFVDGIEICRQVRQSPNYVPILILSARATEGDRVAGLETGSDDYLTKPFSVREFGARAKALLRRRDALTNRSDLSAIQLRFDTLHIDFASRGVTVAGKRADLTAKEFELLTIFAKHPGRVFTRAELLQLVWGYTHSGYEHVVNTHINRLRAKIEPDIAHPHFIRTNWGVGYQFMDGKAADASRADV